MKPDRILCIGAHPDDVEIAMGGSICNFKALGCEVLILDLTDGEPTPHGSPEIRERESKKAARVLGAARKTLDLKNRFLLETEKSREKIIKVVHDFMPDKIFAPHVTDLHPDHIAASKLARFAAFLLSEENESGLQQTSYQEKIIFFGPLHLRYTCHPSFLINISPHFKQKMEAIGCYESQFKVPGKSTIERITTENRYWGTMVGCETAEPFFLLPGACQDRADAKDLFHGQK